MIFSINTTSDISKLLYVNSRAVRRVKFETILKYHEWYLCQILRTNHAIICLYYYPQRFVIFTCRYFKLRWNTTSLSQSNCRNFSCSSITTLILESHGHACDNEIIWPWSSEENRTFVTWLGKLILSEFRQYKNTTAKGLIITKNYYSISFLASGHFLVLAGISLALLSVGKFERHLVA